MQIMCIFGDSHTGHIARIERWMNIVPAEPATASPVASSFRSFDEFARLTVYHQLGN